MFLFRNSGVQHLLCYWNETCVHATEQQKAQNIKKMVSISAKKMKEWKKLNWS